MTTTATKERPIIFTGENVLKIMRGEKNQTRRIIRPQPHQSSRWPKDVWFWSYGRNGSAWMNSERREMTNVATGKVTVVDRRVEVSDWLKNHSRCPYRAGDRLWVKESFYIDHGDYDARQPLPKLGAPTAIDEDQIFYPADAPHSDRAWCCRLIPECCCTEVGKPKSRNPLFMPRWASRLTLEITDVRVQRVQEISEEDARAEGGFVRRCSCAVMTARPRTPIEAIFRQTWCHIHGDEFSNTWDSINGAGSWESNPWVWAITFKVVK